MNRKRWICWLMILMMIVSNVAFGCPQTEAKAAEYRGYFDDMDAYDSSKAEMADGYSNGSMFNCIWRKGNAVFDNSIMSLAIDRDLAGSGYTYSGAEYRSAEKYHYGLYEVCMKPIKNTGVVSSFFTYTGPSDGTIWDEIDIEFLGKDTGIVQFNYFSNSQGNHEYVYHLGFDASEEFHTYGFLWAKDSITWYVDGIAVYTAKENIPVTAGKIMTNVWPGTGVDGWLGAYDGNAPLTAEYDWIKFTPYDELELEPGKEDPEPESRDVITLPLVIRDFKADSLLFGYDIQNAALFSMVYGNADAPGVNSDDPAFDGDILWPITSVIGPAVKDGNNMYSTPGLVNSVLGENGTPVYTEAAITYIANAVKAELERESASDNEGKIGWLREKTGTGNVSEGNEEVVFEEGFESEDWSSQWNIEPGTSGESDIRRTDGNGYNYDNSSYSLVLEGNGGNSFDGMARINRYLSLEPGEYTLKFHYWGEGQKYWQLWNDTIGGFSVGQRPFGDDFGTDSDTSWKEESADFVITEKSNMDLKFSSYDRGWLYVDGISIIRKPHVTRGYVLGDYQASYHKYADGTKGLEDVETCMDYAYYMMNNFFCSRSDINMDDTTWRTLTLLPMGPEDNRTYGFLANFDLKYSSDYNQGADEVQNYKITYDKTGGNIQNDTSGQTNVKENGTGFFPLDGLDYNDNTVSSINGTHNYYYSLQSHGKFIYNRNDNLMFDFTGDDDVYLFINKQLVLDIGGAHSAYTQKISINDLVDDPDNGFTLKEGEVYDFDFFYMERHVDDANIRINTNIKVIQPEAIAVKKAYIARNDVPVASGSEVLKGEELYYEFSLTSDTVPLSDLIFSDEKLGIFLSGKEEDTINLGSGNTYNNIIIIVNDNEGVSQKICSSDAELKAILTEGIKAESTITIKGFKAVAASSFDNEVKITMNAPNSSGGTDSLIRTAQHEYTVSEEGVLAGQEDIYYARQGETIILDILENDKYFGRDFAALTEEEREKLFFTFYDGETVITADGHESADGRIKREGSTLVYIPSVKADAYRKEFTYTCTYGGNTSLPVDVSVYVYDVCDDTYVLDYGLPVELNDDTHQNGIFQNDRLNLLENTRQRKSFDGIKKQSDNSWLYRLDADEAQNQELNGTLSAVDYTGFDAYMPKRSDNAGNVTDTGNQTKTSVVYTPVRFMDHEDIFNYRITIKDKDAVTITPRTGICMEARINIVPASVVYYEDNFGEITYTSTEGISSVNENKTDTASFKQSNSLTDVYGFDTVYDGWYTSSMGETTLTTGTNYGWNLAGTAHGSFTFKGTGIDVIGRTSTDTCIVTVKVYRHGEAAALITRTVDTFYAHAGGGISGGMYQIPVVHIEELPYGEYDVIVSVLPANPMAVNEGAARTTFYLDGVRIYHPLSEDYSYGNGNEAGAQIVEIRKEIIGRTKNNEKKDPAIVFVNVEAQSDGADVYEFYDFGGSVTTENINGITTENGTMTVTSIGDYTKIGPNNEVYLAGGQALAFMITPDNRTADRTVQIEAKSLCNGEMDRFALSVLRCESENSRIVTSYNININSAVARYYEIPLSACTDLGNGSYLVMLKAQKLGETSGNITTPVLSLTNMKIKGYSVTMPSVQTAGKIMSGLSYRLVEETAQTQTGESSLAGARPSDGNMQSTYAEYEADKNGSRWMKSIRFSVEIF